MMPVMSLHRVKVLLALPLLALGLRAQPLPLSTPEAEGISSERLERLHGHFERLVREGKRAGAITLIARHGKIADWRAYGFRNVESKLPMEKDTICRIYSMSKIVASVAALMLLEEGRFELSDPVADYLPEWKNVKVASGGTADAPELVDAKSPITIKHLLTHTSGMIYPDDSVPVGTLYRRAKLFETTSLQEFSERASKLPLTSQPGEAFHYGISVDILGRLVEVVSGAPFAEFLEKRIFDPLGMADTSFNPPPEKNARVATIYSLDAQGRLEPSPRDPYKGLASGGGGLYSTMGDYVRFAQMLANGGELDGKRLLGKKTVELMMANHLNRLARQTTEFSDSDGFGLGGSVRIDLARGDRLGTVGEFGWAGAASTYVRIDPLEKTVALMFMQHSPMDARAFAQFSTLFYQALVK